MGPIAVAALPRPSPWADCPQTWYTLPSDPPPPRETHRREKFSPFRSTTNGFRDTAIFRHFQYMANGTDRGRGPAPPQPLGRLPPNLVHIAIRPPPTPRDPSPRKIFSVLLYDQPFRRYGHF